jgi:hypothetical protein
MLTNFLQQKQRWLSLFVAIIFAVTSGAGMFSSQVYAFDKADNAAINNNWEHWVADQVCIIPADADGPISGSDNIEKAFNYFLQKGLADFQSAGIIGNLMAESNVDPTAQQDGSNRSVPKNGVGFGIAQWTYTDRQGPLVDYADSLSQPVNTLPVQLGYLWKELTGPYASVLKDLKSSKTVEQATGIILNDFEAPAERTQNMITRTKFARDVLSRYGGNPAAVNTVVNTNSSCISGSGAVAGSVVQTALKYAWDDGNDNHGPEKSDAVLAYQSDMPRYNGAVGEQPYSDCGVFISTVMIASGVDKDYPKRGTTLQMKYLLSNPTKYQQLPEDDTKSTASLQPGDILVNTGHTYMYIGQQASGRNSVGASLHDHVPQTGTFYQGNEPFKIFRPIASTEVKA